MTARSDADADMTASQMLERICLRPQGDAVTVGEAARIAGPRAFGLLLLAGSALRAGLGLAAGERSA